MPLFQNSVLKKYLKAQDTEAAKTAYRHYTAYFHNPEIQQNIRDVKEEQFQEGFLRELFVKILGYTLNPQPDFNLTTEFKNEKGAQKADGAILQDGKALAVIELKGADTTDLDKINSQAFNYKNNQSACIYVITSNFEKLRFFIHHAVEYMEFNLFTLTAEEFQILWLCLQAENLLNGIPLKVKEESLLAEEKITQKLYLDYSAFRKALWQNMVQNSPEIDKLLLFKKTQKLLDRFLFIFFAEDKGLLPPNSISKIVEQWQKLKELDEYRPLYERFKKYFGYLNTGWKGKEYEIFAYNGGLFRPDAVLDEISIDDEVLHPYVMKLTGYDFESEVDVNILGHIFEHSLTEMENITAELEGREVEKSKTKRKKDGVFYTPRYITKYIVDNTLGKLCAEKKLALEISEDVYDSARKRSRKRLQNLQAYRDWLLDLTICDPACGSGAFLNQALEFLINEHRTLDELTAKYHRASLILSDIEEHILEKNIYGVDINEESVEIAKLSLWLRTAAKGRKLTSLSHNIKCGNSLIDDRAVAGEKAFNWRQEFPEVFAKGGFDVVIGNPPYGVIHVKGTKDYFKLNYRAFQGNLENYCFFIELFLKITKPTTGKTGLIVPVTWTSIPQFEMLREVVLENNVDSIVELPTKVFSDADLDTLICVVSKHSSSKKNLVNVIKVSVPNATGLEIEVTKPKQMQQALWEKNEGKRIDLEQEESVDKILKRIRENTIQLKEEFKVSQGIVPYAREEMYKTMKKEDADEIVNKRLWHADHQLDSYFRKELKGEDVIRYFLQWNGKQWVKYGDWLARPRSPEYFTKPRVLIREITRGKKLNAAYTEEEFYNNPGIINIITKDEGSYSLKGLLAIINSSLLFYYHLQSSPKAKLKTSIPKILIKDVENIPLPPCEPIDKSGIIEKAGEISESVNNLQQTQQKFSNYIAMQMPDKTISKKLQNWIDLEPSGFLKEFNSAIKKAGGEKLTKSDEIEWMEVFENYKKQVQELQAEIDKNDKEIDQMVYELYGLTEEDIKIVEEA